MLFGDGFSIGLDCTSVCGDLDKDCVCVCALAWVECFCTRIRELHLTTNTRCLICMHVGSNYNIRSGNPKMVLNVCVCVMHSSVYAVFINVL